MRLTRLALRDFRNYREARVDFPARVNVLIGPNAQGKTNLLEAIYVLGTFKAFRTAHNRDLIRLGTETATVTGTVEDGGLSRELEVVLTPAGRRARVNRKPVRSLREFFGACPVVLFSPDDLALAKGPPAGRRRFLDRAVFTGHPAYLPTLQAYMAAVRQKQALLHSGHTRGAGLSEVATREAWDAALVRHGAEVIRRRARLATDLGPHLAEAYRRVAGPAAGGAALAYRPGARVDPAAPLDRLAVELAAAVEAGAAEERRRGTVVVGPHRDDLLLTLDGRDVRLYASQGEQRSVVVALKLAEMALLTAELGTAPLFLLDDVASELDAGRREGLFEALAEGGAQVFLTATALDPGISAQPLDFGAFSVVQGGVEATAGKRLTPPGPRAITLTPPVPGP